MDAEEEKGAVNLSACSQLLELVRSFVTPHFSRKSIPFMYEHAVPFGTSKMAFMCMCHRLTLMYVLRTVHMYIDSIHTAYIQCTE